MYTTASVFWKTLHAAGITHAFVNWGNDHPAMLEDLERQRIENGGKSLLEIITCPNEMVALSAAQGYAQVAGKPAIVIVHVDVGTQALAGAVHNVDKGQTPVLIFAGASPYSVSGEHKGSKNEWPTWGQDVPDQPAIVRQYMRYTAQFMSGKTVAKTIMRAWQFAISGPKGPVYLWARRETLEEEIDENVFKTQLEVAKWPSVQPSALSPNAIKTIVEALNNAKFPMIIASNSGRNQRTVPLLAAFSKSRAIGVFASICPVLCVPFSHPYLLGLSFSGKNEYLPEADVIIILDADIPWIEASGSKAQDTARVFVIDPDPLKKQMGWSHVDAEMICNADAEVALTQLLDAVRISDEQAADSVGLQAKIQERGVRLKVLHDQWMQELDTAAASLAPDGITSTVPFILATLREAVRSQTPSRGENVLWLNEGISEYATVWNHIRPEHPGSMLQSGGSSLGWALGAAIGTRLGANVAGKNYDLITAVVGDGDFLFCVPGTAYWIARRYDTPFLTVILNNGGWKSPRLSMLGVHPNGLGSKVSGRQLTVGFGPEMPDYAGIATAAGGAWGCRVERAADLQAALEEAIRVVVYERRSAVVDCIVEQI
ncbi:thiamine diphosphate-binding protein [Wolfiporia cocos MD-104 SS10]|uniref:Thiamine diphosphate-binding protein n=1 Tax=Wolfiporia cocos (strain MD-104) TaxID=742152 RepID=A0A2H3JKU7_WOLCO|nr:thiamine diphosphate-binding protein [Wolfiporia cocos MD-104 SS10]